MSDYPATDLYQATTYTIGGFSKSHDAEVVSELVGTIQADASAAIDELKAEIERLQQQFVSAYRLWLQQPSCTELGELLEAEGWTERGGAK